MTTELKKAGSTLPRTSDAGAGRTGDQPLFVPRADIYETPDKVFLVAEMPGVQPDGVDIALENRVLTIRGRVTRHPHPGYRLIRAEYGEGDYERAFTLSQTIDQEGIEASFTNGVLHLTLPKAEPAKARKIEIKAA